MDWRETLGLGRNSIHRYRILGFWRNYGGHSSCRANSKRRGTGAGGIPVFIRNNSARTKNMRGSMANGRIEIYRTADHYHFICDHNCSGGDTRRRQVFGWKNSTSFNRREFASATVTSSPRSSGCKSKNIKCSRHGKTSTLQI
jgi:hypothetical protein